MMTPRIVVMNMTALSCVALWASPALADDDDDAKEPRDHEAKVSEKSGGKFSLLGTECKAEEDELETTPGSPPLDVDDTGTPGCNGWEINVVASGEFGKTMSAETPLLDLNYGIGDNIQLKGEMPYELSRSDGVSKSGFGRAEFGIKYRFYEDESRDLSLAVYPQFEFAIPGTAAAGGEEGGGTMTKLPLLFSAKVGETSKGNIMITANVAYNISTEPMTEHYVSAAFGVGFPLTTKIAAMIEGATEQAFSKNMEGVREGVVKANLGLLGRVNPHLLLFGLVGESFAQGASDDAMHTCVLAGFRVLAGGP
jgi:hypothetical protein